MLGLFRSAVARPSWRALTCVSRALVLAATVAACRTDEPTSPARLLPADADRGVSTAATWTWLARSTLYGTEGELRDINDRGWVVGRDRCWRFRDAASLSGGGYTYTKLDSVIWGHDPLTSCWHNFPGAPSYQDRINERGTALMADRVGADFPRTWALVARDNSVTNLPNGLPFALNDSDLVGGTTNLETLGIPGRAVLWRGGIQIDVTPAGFTGGTVMGIDSTGTTYGGRVYYVLRSYGYSIKDIMVCGWMHRRGVNRYSTCVLEDSARGIPSYGGVHDINSRGDAVGTFYNQGRTSLGRRYIGIFGSYWWPASDANPTAEPLTGRIWTAISDKGRLIGTEPGIPGRRNLVTRSPSGSIQLILDHIDGVPVRINSCGIVVGYWYDAVARKKIMSRWIPSVCD